MASQPVLRLRALGYGRQALLSSGGAARETRGLVILHGFVHTTKDVDLLVDSSDANVVAIKRALSLLPGNAVEDIALSDVREYTVVRVVDEVGTIPKARLDAPMATLSPDRMRVVEGAIRFALDLS